MMKMQTIHGQTATIVNNVADDVEAECFLAAVAKHLLTEKPEVSASTFTLLAVKQVERGLSGESIPGHLLLIQIDGLYNHVEPAFRLYHTATTEALEAANMEAAPYTMGPGAKYRFLGSRSAAATYMHGKIVSELGGPLTEASRSHIRATRGI